MPNVIVAAGPVGGASTIPVITYDQKGRLTTVTTATVDDTTKLPLAGGTMTGPINMGTQNITNATSVAATNFSGRNLVLNDNDTNTATIRAPTDITANYALTLPANDGDPGQVLLTDGAGVLSWGAASGGTVTSVSSTNAYLSIATPTTTPALTLNVGTAADTVAAGNDSRIVNAVQAAAYAADLAPAALCTNVQTTYWNTVSDTWACQNINFGASAGFIDGGNSFGATATLGTNDNFNLNFETNGSTKMTILANGNVGIGTLSPSYPLDVQSATAITSGTQYGTQTLITHNPASSGLAATVVGHRIRASKSALQNTGILAGLDSTAEVTASGVSNNTFSVLGAQGTSNVSGSGSFSDVKGVSGVVNINTTGNAQGSAVSGSFDVNSSAIVNIANGGQFGVTTNTAGSYINTAFGVVGEVRSLNGTINEAYGLFSSVSNTAGVVSEGYGLYISAIAGTLNYGIYQSSVSNQNYFAGNVGVGSGVTTPTSVLDVDGAITQRGMAAPAVSAAGRGRIYFDSTSNTFRISQNGSAYADILTSASAIGDITEVVAGAGLTGGATSGSANLAVGAGTGILVNADDIAVNVGTGANQIVQLNGTSQLPAVSGVNLTNLNADNIASGTLPIARGGTGQTTANAALNALLPAQATNAGRVLATDGTNASWVAASTGTVTEVTSANAYLSVATGTTTPALTLNVGTAANTVAAGDDSRITGAVQQTAYAADLAPAALCTNVQTPYWNTVSDAWACQNINFAGGSIALNDLSDVVTNYSTTYNMYLGSGVGVATTTGDRNTGLGAQVMQALTSGTDNTAFGNQSLLNLTTGTGNTAFGRESLSLVSVGSRNTAIGSFAAGTVTGIDNVAVGVESMGLGAGTSYSTAVGRRALNSATGWRNTALGNFAGSNANGASARNIFIGNESGPSAAGPISDSLWIHNAAGDPTIFGDLANRRVGLGGMTDPTTTLDIIGAVTQRGMAAPAVAPAGQGRIYFDSTSNTFQVSENGGAYTDLVGGGGDISNGGNTFGAAATIGTNDNFGLNFETNGSTRMTVRNDGNVGIGDTNPASSLVVRRDVNGQNTLTLSNQFASGFGVGSSIDFLSQAGLSASIQGYEIDSNNGGMAIGIEKNGSLQTAIHIDPYGSLSNVSIGSGPALSEPIDGGRLNINYPSGFSNSTTTLLTLNRSINNPDVAVDGYGSRMIFQLETDENGYFGNFAAIEATADDVSRNSKDGSLKFYTIGPDALNAANEPTEKMRITSAGFVGFGNMDPSTRVDLSGAITQRGMAAPAVSPAGQGRIYFDSTSNTFRVSQNGGAYTDLVGAGDGGLPAAVGSVTAPTIGFVGDPNTGLFQDYADSVSISVGGTERVVVDAGGLFVGDVMLSPMSSNLYPSYSFQSDEDTGMYRSAANTIRFTTAGTDRVTIGATGDLGVGTTSPGTTLDVNGAMALRGIAAPSVSPATQGRIYFDSTTNKFRVSENGGAYTDLVSAGGSGDILNGGNTTGAAVTIGTNDAFGLNLETSGTTKMTILPSGNVGIGVTNPLANFTLRSPAGDVGTFNLDFGNFSHNMGQDSWSGSLNSVIEMSGQHQSQGGGVIAGYGNAGGAALLLRGVVNSQTPTQAPTVITGGKWNGAASSTNISPTEKLFEIQNNDFTPYVTVMGSGNVGIGNTNPGSKLEVSGSVRAVAGAVTSALGTDTDLNIDFSTANVITTTASCNSATLSNMQDGGSYTLIVTGTSSGTCTFTHAGVSAFKFAPANGPTDVAAGGETVYTFLKAGSSVYVSWITGMR